VCAYDFKFKVHCGSAFEPGASGIPYYYTTPVTVPDVIGARAMWRQNTKKNQKNAQGQTENKYYYYSQSLGMIKLCQRSKLKARISLFTETWQKRRLIFEF